MNNWTPQDWYAVIGIGEIVVGALMLFLTLYLRQGYVTRKEHDAAHLLVGQDHDALERRVDLCERSVSNAATKDDVHNIQLAVADMKGQSERNGDQIRALHDRLDRDLPAVTGAVERIEDYLMNGKR